MSLSKASLRCELLHCDFVAVKLDVDAHELKLRAILSFVVHLPTWVRFARNNMYIQNDKNEA